MYKIPNQRFSYNFLFYWLLILVPFIYYVKYTAYGFFHLEIAMMFGLLTLVSCCLTLLEKYSGWLGRILISTLIITISFSFLPGFKNIGMMLVVYFIALFLTLLLDNHIRTIIIIMACTFIISLFLFPIHHQGTKYSEQHFEVKQAVDTKLPTVIHLMLDEHAGIEGIPIDIAQGKQLRADLKNFYNSNGFHVYAGAYSHYMQTFNSVSNLVNFSSKPISHYYFNHNSKLTQNTYFKLMTEKGYRIRVYQFNSMIDYCDTKHYPIESCYNYPAANLNSILRLDISAINKFLFIIKSYLLWSETYQILMNWYQNTLLSLFHKIGINLPIWGWYQARTSSVYIPTIFQQIAQDVKQHPTGTFFYAHILGPHNPYIYDANCQLIKNPMDWQINIDPDPILNTAKSRQRRYTLYENQLRCVTKQVQSLIADLKQEGIYDKTIIIINGDHGSRITENLAAWTLKIKFTRQSYRDSFNAFFAVKMPSINPTSTDEPITIQQLLANVVGKITGALIPVENSKPYGFLVAPGYHGKMYRIYLSDIKY